MPSVCSPLGKQWVLDREVNEKISASFSCPLKILRYMLRLRYESDISGNFAEPLKHHGQDDIPYERYESDG